MPMLSREQGSLAKTKKKHGNIGSYLGIKETVFHGKLLMARAPAAWE